MNLTEADKILRLQNEAVAIMSQSQDILHDNGHIRRILEDWSKLSEEIDEKVDCRALVLAVCWHDVWLAIHNYEGVLGVLWEYVSEGRGSARMFRRSAERIGLNQNTIDLVADAIKNHPSLPFNKQTTVEAKILWDLDNLETWSWPRLEKMVKKIDKGIDKGEMKQIKMGRLYWNLIMKKRTADRFYFEWSKKEFEKRKMKFEKKILNLRL